MLILVTSPVAGVGLSGEVPAAAATHLAAGGGDIPDSAVYLTYTAPHFRIKYVEGWGRQGSGSQVTFSDKDSVEQITLLAPLRGSLEGFVRGHELSALRHTGATQVHGPAAVTLPAGRAWYLQYLAPSSPDQVTGKVVSLRTDRYYLAGPHQVAVLTLAAPLTDDNVDAFRLISRSFAWR
jgi:hypothetical protein